MQAGGVYRADGGGRKERIAGSSSRGGGGAEWGVGGWLGRHPQG